MLAEILLGYFYLLAVNQAHVTDSAISKAIDDRATYPFSQIVVDEGTQVCTDGSKHDDQNKRHSAAWIHGFPGSRWNNHLRWERNERAFDCHKQCNHPIIQVIQDPKKEICSIHNY